MLPLDNNNEALIKINVKRTCTVHKRYKLFYCLEIDTISLHSNSRYEIRRICKYRIALAIVWTISLMI